MDAPGKGQRAGGTEADERSGETTAPRSEISAATSQGRQLWRAVSARRPTEVGDLADRGGRNARAAYERGGVTKTKGGTRPRWVGAVLRLREGVFLWLSQWA